MHRNLFPCLFFCPFISILFCLANHRFPTPQNFGSCIRVEEWCMKKKPKGGNEIHSHAEVFWAGCCYWKRLFLLPYFICLSSKVFLAKVRWSHTVVQSFEHHCPLHRKKKAKQAALGWIHNKNVNCIYSLGFEVQRKVDRRLFTWGNLVKEKNDGSAAHAHRQTKDYNLSLSH